MFKDYDHLECSRDCIKVKLLQNTHLSKFAIHVYRSIRIDMDKRKKTVTDIFV